MLLSVSEAHRAQQRLTVATLSAVRSQWERMSAEFDASWLSVGPRVVTLTTAGMLASARQASAYVPAALAEQGSSVDPLGSIRPAGFAASASDGRTLDGLMQSAVTRAKQAIGAGATVDEALLAGRSWLDMAVWTQIADSFRSATAVGIAARPGVGWVRMVNPPCCKRCAVLAGKWFKWNQGFQRHPRCDCKHVPAGGGKVPAGFTEQPPLHQITDLTAGEHKALASGADLGRVVNASRGASGMTTTEGATRPGRARLTPDGILRLASDQAEAVRLLRLHGYIL